ncbi:dihydrodipicolinate synthase family protein, partial [Candidatus Bipolaricaulota bacterium]|nr:dihydrodipicolinate synthase family protein [Candidatus Bipolaricaulota bacterium]
GIDLDAELIARLAAHENVIGLKDSSGNVVKLATLRGMVDREFRILAGSAGFFLPALSVGADGGVMALANIAAAECVAIYQAFRAGDTESAQEIQLRLVELNTAVTARWSVPGLKVAMDLVGLYGGPPRPPLRPIPREAVLAIEDLLHRAGLL